MSASEYRTVKETAGPVSRRIKGSRFIAFLYPCRAGETETILSPLAREFHDASHICYACRFPAASGEAPSFRYHDDGEPTHTAGLPIYRELERAVLFDVLLAVIRYFGGTKLGCGGLTRAYRDSARGVIQTAHLLTVTPTVPFILEVPYARTGQVMGLINKYNFTITHQQHLAAGTRLTVSVSTKDADKIPSLFSAFDVRVIRT